MFSLDSTGKWLDSVIRSINEKQYDPTESRFILALFSSLDSECTSYFKDKKAQISAYTGSNVHVFTPLIYENNTVPDEELRIVEAEFTPPGGSFEPEPTFIFFELTEETKGGYRPHFFAAYRMPRCTDIASRLKRAFHACIPSKGNQVQSLPARLEAAFQTPNILRELGLAANLSDFITNKLPKKKVFISHSSQDKPFVRALVQDLINAQLPVWIDEVELKPGDNIMQGVTQGIRASSNLIVVVSEDSTKSKWVHSEISQFLALGADKRIIPILLSKGRKFPSPLETSLASLRYLDFSDETKRTKNIEELIAVLRD